MIRPVLLSASITGLLGGHFLGYLTAVPSQSSRHAVLASSGHAYLGTALVFGLLAALITLGGSIWLGYRKKPVRLGSLTARLAIMQMSSYLAMEFAERWIAGGSFDGLPTLLALGLVAQVGVALAAAVLIVLMARVGDQIRLRISAGSRRLRNAFGRPSNTRPAFRPPLGTVGTVRGPPQPRTI